MTDPCQARAGSDQQTRCAACGLVWDTNDPEPPMCGRKQYASGGYVTPRDLPLMGERCTETVLPYASGLPAPNR